MLRTPPDFGFCEAWGACDWLVEGARSTAARAKRVIESDATRTRDMNTSWKIPRIGVYVKTLEATNRFPTHLRRANSARPPRRRVYLRPPRPDPASRHSLPQPQEQVDGVEESAGQPADDGAVDPDVLQVVARVLLDQPHRPL